MRISPNIKWILCHFIWYLNKYIIISQTWFNIYDRKLVMSSWNSWLWERWKWFGFGSVITMWQRSNKDWYRKRQKFAWHDVMMVTILLLMMMNTQESWRKRVLTVSLIPLLSKMSITSWLIFKIPRYHFPKVKKCSFKPQALQRSPFGNVPDLQLKKHSSVFPEEKYFLLCIIYIRQYKALSTDAVVPHSPGPLAQLVPPFNYDKYRIRTVYMV